MNIIEKNATIFDTLKQTYPELNSFIVKDGFLIFGDKKLDLTKYDLELLINKDFINTIKGKKPEEIFKIFEEKLTKKQEISNKDKLSTIVMENPSMKNITIFTNEDINTHEKEEFINIRTSNGENYLFKNDMNFDLFEFYYSLERIYGDNITPDIVAKEIEKWSLNKLEVLEAQQVLNKEDCKQSFKNKVREIQEQFRDRPEIKVEANIEEEIVYVNDENTPENNIIITFEYDINNELVMRTHKNNVKQEIKTVKDIDMPQEEPQVVAEEKIVSNIVGNSNLTNNNMGYTSTETTISKQELIEIISKDGPYSEEELNKVNAFFNDIMLMITNDNVGYEEIINDLNAYVESVQVSKDSYTERETDFMNRCYQLYDEVEKKKGVNKGAQLTLTPNGSKTSQVAYDDSNNYGFSSPASIIILISSIVVVLSIIVLSLF